MNIIIRDYRPNDEAQIVDVYRDGCNSLRQSRGGLHPETTVDTLLNKPDKKIGAMLTKSRLSVAEVKETGELAGIGGMTNGLLSRILKSTFSKNHYVKEKFQRGRAGIHVGAMLRQATIDRAKNLGFRKIYGYSTQEATGFHKRFGARFFPKYDSSQDKGLVQHHYYEIELRYSIWNKLRIEPHIFLFLKTCGQIVEPLRKLIK